MDVYLHVLEKRIEELDLDNGIDAAECALLMREMLKYFPDNTSLMNAIARVLIKMRFHWEAYCYLSKSCKIDKNSQARDLLRSLDYSPLPDVVTFETTTVCNLRCPLCITGSGKLYRKNRHMSYEDFCSIYDGIKESTNEIILVGQGETFLNPDIYRILDYIEDRVFVYLDTNGNVDLDYEKIISSGVDEITFSIDGINQETYERYRKRGNFGKAVRNLVGLIKARNERGLEHPKIIWKFVVFKHTEMYVEQARKLAFSHGVDGFRIEPCTCEPLYGIERFKEFMPLSEKYQRIEYIDFDNFKVGSMPDRDSRHCPVPMHNLTVDVNGDVTFCCAIDTSVVRSFGNLKKQTLEEIWWSEAVRNFRFEVLKNKHSRKSLPELFVPD